MNSMYPNLKKELEFLLFDEDKKESMLESFRELRALLTKGGRASANAAKLVFDLLGEQANKDDDDGQKK